jgi:Fe-S cluster biogenesis protein NfuA
MIRSMLKKLLGRDEQKPSSSKPYPFKYEPSKAKAAPSPAPEPEDDHDHGHSHSHGHSHGHGEPAPEPVVEAAPEPVAEAPAAKLTVADVELMTVKELRGLIKERGLKARSKASKSEIIAILTESGGNGDEDAPTDAPLIDIAEVQDLLDDMVRPALQADGGDISLLKIEGADIHVRLVGACSTCPSSIMTMKMGVEALLREEFPAMQNLIQVD